VGQDIFVGKRRYRVVGVLEEKGSSFGSGMDRVIAIPITTGIMLAGAEVPSLGLSIYVEQSEQLPAMMALTAAYFRNIRRLRPEDPDDFATAASSSFVENLMENLAILTISATIIAVITLFGAAVGLMNIMLVSVTERTREIGVRKALGATSRNILMQFLIEAVTITQLGGVVGILLGVAIGNAVGFYLGTPFFVPWIWVGLAIAICFVVGIVSGIYPARKAAQMDPIESLRYE
jgi:putative ABC transport system permease protein